MEKKINPIQNSINKHLSNNNQRKTTVKDDTSVEVNDDDKMYFTYRHFSLNNYILSSDYRRNFDGEKIEYEHSVQQFIENRVPPEPEKKLISSKQQNPKDKIHLPNPNYNNLCQNLKQKKLPLINPNTNKIVHIQNKNSETHKNEGNYISNSNNSELVSTSNPNQKKFLVLGGYRDLVNSFLNRGWAQLTDPKTMDFDYIWTLKTCDINFQKLNKTQFASHFKKNISICLKSGINCNIQNLYFKGIDPNNFFPRSYDLSINEEYKNFLEDFKTTKAISILRLFSIQCEDPSNNENTISKFSESMLKVAIDIVYKKLNILTCDYPMRIHIKTFAKLISDNDWNIISEEDMNDFNKVSSTKHNMPFITYQRNQNDPRNAARSRSEVHKKDQFQKLSSNKLPDLNQNNNINTISTNNQNSQINQNNLNHIAINSNISNNSNLNNINTINLAPIKKIEQPKPQRPRKITKLIELDKYKEKVTFILSKLKSHLVQYDLNGHRNIWIIKPSSLSRGRGISCHNKLGEIMALYKENPSIIVQKYIENPLIILSRKFDIRQWVLVSNLNPLTLWIWEEPYLRFSAEDYNINELSNIYSHLTNNSIAKYSSHFHDVKIDGNMWEISQFKEFLFKKYGRDMWPELQQKIKNIIICSFFSARHKIIQRNNSHELFGYDVMIDENLNIYLIEVNSSPDMSYSTKVTKKLVPLVLENIVKIVVDNKDNISNINKVDRFTKIFQGQDIDKTYLPNKNLDIRIEHYQQNHCNTNTKLNK